MGRAQTLSFNTGVHYSTVGSTPIAYTSLIARQSWLTGMLKQIACDHLRLHYNVADLTTVLDQHQNNPQSQPEVAARQLGWGFKVEDYKGKGIYYTSRVLRLGVAYSMTVLRSAAARSVKTQTIIDLWSTGLTLKNVNTKLEEHGLCLNQAEFNNRVNAISNHVKKHSRLPADLLDLEPNIPTVDEIIIMGGVVDKQFSVVAAQDHRVCWKMLLPAKPKPQSGKDYGWVNIHFQIPEYVRQNIDLCAPNLRLVTSKDDKTSIYLDCAYKVAVPATARRVKRRYQPVVGVDWGVSTLLTASVVSLSRSGKIKLESQPLFYQIDELSRKLKELKTHNNNLLCKIKSLEKLLSNNPNNPALLGKVQQLSVQREWVNARRRNLNRQIAHSAAKWLISQVLLVGAKTVVVEDLKSLYTHTPSSGRNLEVGVDTVRGKIYGYLQDWCHSLGIDLIVVNPQSTSRQCSHCLSANTGFFKHSTLKEKGWGWFHCYDCNYTVNRDFNAANNIGIKGIQMLKFATMKTKVADKPAVVKVPTRKPTRGGPRRKISKYQTKMLKPSPVVRRVQSNKPATLNNNPSSNRNTTNNRNNSSSSSSSSSVFRLSISYSKPSMVAEKSASADIPHSSVPSRKYSGVVLCRWCGTDCRGQQLVCAQVRKDYHFGLGHSVKSRVFSIV